MWKIDLKYILLLFGVVFMSYALHELGHYLAGTLLGNSMGMNLNMAYPLSGEYQADWHKPLVYSGGPLFSALQAGTALVLLSSFHQKRLFFALLLTPATLRIWPYLVSPFHQQDEARVAAFLGFPEWILPLIVWLILITIAYSGVRKINVTKRFIVLSVLLILIAFQVVLRLNNLFL